MFKLCLQAGPLPGGLPPSACTSPPSPCSVNSLSSSLHTCDLQAANKPARAKSRSSLLCQAITSCLRGMPVRSGCNDSHTATTKDVPVFITKWIDYSNKYGFGFQLSDKSVGVLFNDHTRISYSADRG